MSTLRLDLSPMLVNRTAAYNLCLDVQRIVSAMPGGIGSYQFFGHTLPTVPSGNAARAYVSDFFQAVGRGDFAPQEISLWDNAADAQRTLYMDPLYVLFGQLRRQDTVLLLDLSPVTHPQWHAPQVSAAYEKALRLILQVRPNLASISRNTIDTLEANYGDYGQPIQHLPLYPPDYIRQGAQSGDVLRTPWPYFLFVGSLEARKNMLGAIKAFALSDLAASGYRLLIIGGRGHGADDIQHLAQSTEGVVIAGFLTEGELCAAYAGATGFIYPSYLEGFGVPLLEAMTFGVPSVASIAGACPEVAGPDVPLVDPDDHLTLARHMQDIVSMDTAARQKLGAKLRARAETGFAYDQFFQGVQQMVAA